MKRLFLLFVVASCVGSTADAAVAIDAKVDGVLKTIGSLDVVIDPGNAGRVIGTFTLNAECAFLDGWYDFQWINVETAYENPVGTPQATDPVLGTLPAIDPRNVAGEDDKPFYYNDGEWLPPGQLFGGQAIHQEGVLSRFRDRPSDLANNSKISFSTYLVVQNMSDPAMPLKEFEVIGGFDWTYTNLPAPGSSSIAVTRGTGAIVAADATLINTAIANANPAFAAGWTAKNPGTMNLVQCPEPSSLALAGIGLAGAFLWGKRRRAA